MITAGCYESKDGKKISKKNYFGVFIFGLFMGFTLQTNYVKVHGEPAEKTVSFRDNSGNYLKKFGDSWYLRNAKKQKLTGIQYLNIDNVEYLKNGFYMFDDWKREDFSEWILQMDITIF